MKEKPRLYALDGMRGLCAVALMLYHHYFWLGRDWFQIGYFGVYVFFMLSGFSMWYVYAGKMLDIGLLRHFFAARIARIVPLYVLAVAFSALARLQSKGMDGITNADFLCRAALNITMLFGFAMPGETSVVPGGWSIGIEWVFYLAFPLFLLSKRRLSTILYLLAFAFGLNQLIVWALLVESDLVTQWSYYTNFPSFLVYFIAGIAACMLYERGNGERLARYGWLCRAIPLAALMGIACYPSPTPEAYLQGLHVAVLVAAGMAGLFFASLIRLTAWEIRLCRFLGDISYSTYLMNFFVYHAVAVLLSRLYPGYPPHLHVLLAAAGTLPVAYGLYRWYEMPARNWINRRL